MKYLIILLLLLSSCSLEKRLAKYCPLCVQKDSTITVIKIKDTTITIPGETFVDQFGFCWVISPLPIIGFTLLTGSFIQYASLYVDCEDCIENNNPCENVVYYTIQNCLTLETEIVQYQFGLPVDYSFLISFTTNFSPRCYKIISWDNTSLPTKIIDEVTDCSIDCETCLGG